MIDMNPIHYARYTERYGRPPSAYYSQDYDFELEHSLVELVQCGGIITANNYTNTDWRIQPATKREYTLSQDEINEDIRTEKAIAKEEITDKEKAEKLRLHREMKRKQQLLDKQAEIERDRQRIKAYEAQQRKANDDKERQLAAKAKLFFQEVPGFYNEMTDLLSIEFFEHEANYFDYRKVSSMGEYFMLINEMHRLCRLYKYVG